MEIFAIENIIIGLLTPEQAWHFRVVPFEFQGDILKLYYSDIKFSSQDEIEILLNKSVLFEKIEENLLIEFLNKYYRKNSKNLRVTPVEINSNNTDFIEQLIQEALSLGSSDIHLEPSEKFAKIRFRIDGKLMERHTVDLFKYAELINRVKIKANLDISEKRLPQDGRVLTHINNQKLDLRISIIPTLNGEKIVLRLLGANAENLDLNNLGFNPNDLKQYLLGTKKSNGIILISGPTGSGKTTTLYATLKLLNKPDVNIMTIEDPVEYTLNGISQVQVKENIGLTFAASLRSFLRQDPDIIMIGEIRDKETAELAIRASLTGHLVLSTIHTNSAWGTINRLKDMGIPSFLISDTLNSSVAQRLVRTLCPHCKKQIPLKNLPNDALQYCSDKETINAHKIVGCEQCYFTGYSGRKAIYEVVNIDDEIKDLIKQNGILDKIKTINYTSLQDNVLQLFKDGITSWEETYTILISK